MENYQDQTTELLRNELAIDRKKPIPFPLKTIQEVNMHSESYKDERAKFIYLWTYLTGQRITEVLKTTRADVRTDSLDDGREYMIVNSITLKNKRTFRRSLPVPLFGPEKSMTERVWREIEGRDAQLPVVLGVSRTNAWNLLSAHSVTVEAILPEDRTLRMLTFRIFPHYLRHCRASHLAEFSRYDIYDLMQYFGWSKPETASVYAVLRWHSLAKLFKKEASNVEDGQTMEVRSEGQRHGAPDKL